MLGLATAGLAVTAATYVSVGGATPLRAGLSLVKDARKVGRLGEGLAAWAGRSAREVVDAPALQQAVASSSVLRPGESVSAIKAAFRAEKAGGLVRLAKDVGRVTEKAGTRGALDTLKIAEGPKDVARAARLAEAKGGQTRAILKILGRGALLLATGMFDLALWLFGALLTLFSVLCSIKSTTERATQAWLDRKRARRLRRQMAAGEAATVAAAGRLKLALQPFRHRSSPKRWNCRCRAFTTAMLKLPISTKARAIRSCSCTALPRPRTSTGSIRPGSRSCGRTAAASSRSTIAAMANPPSSTIPRNIQFRIMSGDIVALMDHLKIDARRHHGLFAGRTDGGVARAERAGSGCARRSSAASALP